MSMSTSLDIRFPHFPLEPLLERVDDAGGRLLGGDRAHRDSGLARRARGLGPDADDRGRPRAERTCRALSVDRVDEVPDAGSTHEQYGVDTAGAHQPRELDRPRPADSPIHDNLIDRRPALPEPARKGVPRDVA